MADKTDLAWNFYDDEDVSIPGQSAPAAEAPSRSFGEVTQDVLSSAVDTLAAGGDGRQIIGSMLQAGMGTDRYMAQKRILANQAKLSDLKVRGAQRAEQYEIEDRPIQQNMQRAKLALTNQQVEFNQRRLDRDAYDQDMVQVNKDLVSMVRQLPEVQGMSEQEIAALLASPAGRQMAEFMYWGRLALNSRKDPEAWGRFQRQAEQSGWSVIEKDGGYAIRRGDVVVPLNEMTGEKLFKTVQGQLAQEAAARAAVSLSATSGNTVARLRADWVNQNMEYAGGSAPAATNLYNNIVKGFTPEQRMMMVLRRDLQDLLDHSDDPEVMARVQMLLKPDGAGMTILDRLGYKVQLDGENPLNSRIIQNNPDGSTVSMSLPLFLEEIKKRDTGTQILEKQGQELKNQYEEQQKIKLIQNTEQLTRQNAQGMKQIATGSAARVQLKYGDKIKGLSPASQQDVGSSSEMRTLVFADMLEQANGNPELQKQIIKQSGGKFFEKDGKTFFKYGEHEEMELTPENVEKLRTWSEERVDNLIDVSGAVGPNSSEYAPFLTVEQKYAAPFVEAFGGDRQAAYTWLKNNTPLTGRETAYMDLRQDLDMLLQRPEWKKEFFEKNTPGSNLADDRIFKVTGYKVSRGKSGVKFYKEDANGNWSESLTFDQFLQKVRASDTGTKKVKDTMDKGMLAAKQMAQKQQAKGGGKKKGNDGGDENGPTGELSIQQVDASVNTAKVFYGNDLTDTKVPQEKRGDFAKDFVNLHSRATNNIPGDAFHYDPKDGSFSLDVTKLTAEQTQRMADAEEQFAKKYGLDVKQGFWYKLNKLINNKNAYLKASHKGRPVLVSDAKVFNIYTERRRGTVARVDELVKMGFINKKDRDKILAAFEIAPNGNDLYPNFTPQNYEEWKKEYRRRAEERGAEIAERIEKKEKQYKYQENAMNDQLGDTTRPGL